MPYRLKIIIAIALVESLVLIGLVATSVNFLENTSRQAFVQSVESHAAELALLVRDAVLSSDIASLEAIARHYMEKNDSLYLRISDETRVLIEYGIVRNNDDVRSPDSSFTDVDDGIFDVHKLIYVDSFAVGRLETGISTAKATAMVSDARSKLIFIAAIEVLLVGILSWFLGRYLIRDLKKFREQLDTMASGLSRKQLYFPKASEFHDVAHAFNRMAAMVELREKDRDSAFEATSEAVNALKEREASLELLLNTVTDGIILVDEQMSVQDINEAAARTLKFSAGEMLGRPLASIFTLDSQWHDALRVLQQVIDHKLGTRQNLGKLQLGAAGSSVWVDLSAASIARPSGRYLVLAFKDLTTELSTHSEIQRRELLHKAITVASLDSILVLDEHGIIVDANPSAEVMLGRTRGALVDQHVDTTLKTAFSEQAFELPAQSQNGANERGQASGIKLLTLTGADGSHIPVSYRTSHFRWTNKEYTTLLLRDLREQQLTELSLLEAKEAAEKANFAKSNFLSHVTHEIRSPLNATMGCVDLLMSTDLNPQQVVFAESAKQSSNVLLSLVNNILDFARIESGTLELNTERFNVIDVLESVLDIKSLHVDQTQVALCLVADPNVDMQCFGDSVRLRQVLANLVDNALKFTDRGGVTLTAKLAETIEDGYRIEFSVEDTGIGIPRNKRDTIFDAFTQVDSTDATLHGGSGLGLAICKELVERMGGRFRLDSVVDQGSRFTFDIPMACSVQDRLPLETELNAVVLSRNAVFQTALRTQLSSLGFNVEMSSDMAIQKQYEKTWLFVDDIQLMDTSKKTNSASDYDRIVLLVDKKTFSSIPTEQRLRADSVLIKPVHYSRLRELICLDDTPQPPQQIIEQTDFGECYPEASGGDVHILLAEDSQANQLVATTMLEKRGYRIWVANNGNEVLEALDQQAFDLVLMDLRMPIMDGLEATRRIRQSGADYASIPIIALTANATKEDEVRCKRVGMDAFIGKPFQIDELTAAIEQQLASAGETGRMEKTTLSLMDATIVDRLITETSESVVDRMVQVFIREVERRLNELLDAFARGDCHRVEDEAHTIKSNASTFGAVYLASLCKEIEQSCKRMDKEKVANLIPELEEVTHKTLKVYGSQFGNVD
ncbi:ATP-binding protein [Marinobacter fonticola]|uniref:ATP-binding protein n=1 Tax=Marinobacter fonticola TaxID=2603215 RepID=UPI0011E67C2D|nr:ATP-binding protein [Marinobacter fonticola]